MRGYHRDPEATARVLDAEGWLRTGDLGEWTARGLRIRGRLDGVFKLENGEKVSSGAVESRILASTPSLHQALVLGPGQRFVTALLWAGGPATPEMRREVIEALQSGNSLAPRPHERVRRAALIEEAPTIASGELTPTMKLVRPAVLARHGDVAGKLAAGAADPRIIEIDRREAT